MIRLATHDDVDALVDLVSSFYAEAPYEAPEVVRDQSAYILDTLVSKAGTERVFLEVIEVRGKVVGAICAERIPDIWSNAEKVVEHFIYILPKYRGMIHTGKLLKRFAEWTRVKPAVVRVEAGSGIDDEKVGAIFERLGWQKRGVLYGSEAY